MKLYSIKISLPQPIEIVTYAEDEDDAHSRAEGAVLRALERGEFVIEIERLNGEE